MSRVLGALLALIGIAYPFAVYFGLQHWSPRQFGLLLSALWLARLLLGGRTPGRRPTALALLAFCILLSLWDNATLLRWYPVLINLSLLAAFALSLRHGPPLIERAARLRHPRLSSAAVRWTRGVTQVWCGFFVVNGAIAAALTLWAPLSWWTLYNGFIAYLLIGALLAGEWLLRPTQPPEGQA